MNYNFYVYILTNIHRQVLYTGVTNNLARRIDEHATDAAGAKKTFAGKYNCIYLVYWSGSNSYDPRLRGKKRSRDGDESENSTSSDQ